MSIINYYKQKGKSKYQEKLAEYAFLKDLMLCAAQNEKDILISRSDFDDLGFDLIIQEKESGKSVFVQLKAFNGKASVWDVHKSIVENEKGKIVLIKLLDTNNSISFEYYLLKEENKITVTNRKPKVKHRLKCKTLKGDYKKININDLFDKFFK